MKRASGLLGVAILVAACGGAMQGAPAGSGTGAGSAARASPPGDGGPGSCGAAADRGALGGSVDGGAGAASAPDAGPAPTGLLGPGAVAVPELKSPVPSAFVPDLQALGLDPAHMPPIEKLDPKALRGVMKLMAKSLGIKCADCHKEGDFAAPTRRKKIAAKMWDELVVKLAFAAPDGAPFFCDSCHQGRV